MNPSQTKQNEREGTKSRNKVSYLIKVIASRVGRSGSLMGNDLDAKPLQLPLFLSSGLPHWPLWHFKGHLHPSEERKVFSKLRKVSYQRSLRSRCPGTCDSDIPQGSITHWQPSSQGLSHKQNINSCGFSKVLHSLQRICSCWQNLALASIRPATTGTRGRSAVFWVGQSQIWSHYFWLREQSKCLAGGEILSSTRIKRDNR